MRVAIEASRYELAFFADEHARLDEDLQAAGLDVVRADLVEYRGAAQDIIEGVRITVEAAGTFLTVKNIVERTLRRRAPRRPRETVILDHRGRPLSRVHVPAEDESSAT